MKEPKEEIAIGLIVREFIRASQINGPFNSAHEGYAVILEELDELKAEVWKKAISRDPHLLLREAVQVGAMALRFITDLIDFESLNPVKLEVLGMKYD